MAIRVDPAILEILGRAETNGHVLRLTDHIEPGAYKRVARVIEASGGRWDKRAQAYLFEDRLAIDAIEPMLLTGLVSNERQDLGAFFTPPEIAARIIARAEIEDGMIVLEPSAGRGALAHEAVLVGARVDCIDVDAENIRFLELGFYRRVWQADFLNEWPKPDYDRVVMNPPFARQHDIAHVTHALRFLKPGGRLVAIMSAGITFRINRRADAFRHLVEAGAGTVAALPDGSFRAAGTEVRTVLVTIEATAALGRALKAKP